MLATLAHPFLAAFVAPRVKDRGGGDNSPACFERPMLYFNGAALLLANPLARSPAGGRVFGGSASARRSDAGTGGRL